VNGSAWSWLLVLPAALLVTAGLCHLHARRLVGLPRAAIDRWRQTPLLGKILVCVLFAQFSHEGVTKLLRNPPAQPPLPPVAVVQPDAGDLDFGVPATNLCFTAIERGTNSTALLFAWPTDNRPPLDRVGLFTALELPGPSIMLGYNGEAPADKGGAPARIIQSWLANRSVMSDVDAWLKANANNRAWNACAIVKGQKYLYFKRKWCSGVVVKVPKGDW